VDDLNMNELKELVLFYKQQYSDIQLESLQRQLKINRLSDTVNRLSNHLDSINSAQQQAVVETKKEEVKKKTKTTK
jgi:hypothetical protein